MVSTDAQHLSYDELVCLCEVKSHRRFAARCLADVLKLNGAELGLASH